MFAIVCAVRAILCLFAVSYAVFFAVFQLVRVCLFSCGACLLIRCGIEEGIERLPEQSRPRRQVRQD